MSVKLDYIIPASNFESVRDLIASILKLELDNQSVLRGTGGTGVPPSPVVPNLDYTASIYTERFVPVADEEGNVIVVGIEGGNLDNQTPISQSFDCSYYIDIYTNAKETSTNTGYYNSGVKLHRLVGLVRHILQSPYYDRLTCTNGIVERRSVSRIQFARVSDEQDASSVRMGRITLNVRTNENQNEITPTIAAGYNTVIKISTTNKGFLITYNNE